MYFLFKKLYLQKKSFYENIEEGCKNKRLFLHGSRGSNFIFLFYIPLLNQRCLYVNKLGLFIFVNCPDIVPEISL